MKLPFTYRNQSKDIVANTPPTVHCNFKLILGHENQIPQIPLAIRNSTKQTRSTRFLPKKQTKKRTKQQQKETESFASRKRSR